MSEELSPLGESALYVLRLQERETGQEECEVPGTRVEAQLGSMAILELRGLIAKGLVTAKEVEGKDPEAYALTEAGRKLIDEIVAQRATMVKSLRTCPCPC